jgi:hypothetical protein
LQRTFEGLGDTSFLVGRTFEFETVRDDTPLVAPHSFDVPAQPAAPPARLEIWFGFSAPTGEPERPDPRIVTRDVSVTNLQTGSGTFDPQARVRFLPGGDAPWFLELAARVPVSENRYDYRTGEVVALAAGTSAPLSRELTGGLTATLQHVGRDRFRGHDVAVGGGRWLYATPSLRWDLSADVALDLSLRVTLWRDVDTKLSDSRWSVQAGLVFRF